MRGYSGPTSTQILQLSGDASALYPLIFLSLLHDMSRTWLALITILISNIPFRNGNHFVF